ncbi:MAG: 16S rRNA (cytosine(967)-C(5))-methyltransferase RsmB [Candidatus Zixiibacteriota bacterium]
MVRNSRQGRRGRRPVHKNINPFGANNARAVAYDLTVTAMKGSERLEQMWDHNAGLAALSSRDRALAVHLAAGVLRRLRVLDHRANYLTDGKFDGLSEPVQWVLRMGLFQVVDCDRIPPHAAVSTAVEAAKTVSHQGIAGLVNAVLRRAARERDQLHEMLDTAPPAEKLSMPDWLINLLITKYGEDNIDRIARWANAPPHHFVRLFKGGPGLARLNELLASVHLLSAKPHPTFEDYVEVETAALTSDSPLYSEPIGWVQNPASGLVVKLLDPQPGDQVIDLFAAPGGKSLLISELVGPDGRVLAVDRSADRLKRLAENKQRFGADNMLAIQADVSSLGDRTAMRVLADVPCSALGTLPKNPEVRWVKSPADIERLSRSQRIWLNVASRHVAPGGVLVYATCTITTEENEHVVRSFLESNDAFELESGAPFVPKQFVTSEGYVASRPPFDGLDGVFAARLRRKHADG